MKVTVLVTILGFLVVFRGFSFGSGEEHAGAKSGVPMAAIADNSGGKIPFSTLEDARAVAEKGPAVLFFSADWCPTCRAANQDIDVRLDDLGDITVIVVNYDMERELKRTYGITSQHTFVQIDPEGEAIALWNGGGVDQILKKTGVIGEE